MACFHSRLLLHESQKRSRTRLVSRSPRYSATQQLATDHFGATGHRIPYQRPFLRQNRLCQPASQKGLGLLEHQSTIQYTFAIQQPRPQHLPRGLAQRIFSQPPRLSTSPLPLPHGPPRRSAKNALLYVTSGSALLNCLAQRERRMGRRFRGSTIPNYIRFHWFTK